jgi:sec-independent protein translocase protein TatA
MRFGVTELLLILGIAVVLFGTKRLQSIGGDVGGAIRNFRTAMKDDSPAPVPVEQRNTDRVG